ncbi:potassium-transporting ATPase subunit A [Burkholderia sp. MSMB617WGS]|uniref:Potassium-transporting ATPase subunit A n=1 Tax=Burkholderia savannae TaxID=1637837 RepID=A0ABR5TF63_9BURK|nr:potassium-transporting ATPase subunit A [Burkholderia sp. MSMB617WGS]KGR95161.1 putative membrane protein [Burkholderia sp. ABCPW 111]KVG83412.1 potassium-transporting ATPase subunit A [Burkholderia sp. MSMB2040]KVG92026.1 potassium-transporting ATPase subunit A [Burkholderia sp. MSMB2041]KVK92023.1 potassium-transporting ATPase subunit A [Burkholderia sp. MSMB1498]KWZ43640.1 potassium-transporting ATPase subunit A [Burkholderia savannae]
MDAVYIGGLALFTGLMLALIAGCEKLARYGRGGRS